MRRFAFAAPRAVVRPMAPAPLRYYAAPAKAAKVNAVEASIKDTFDRFAKDGDFANAYEELVLRGFSDTDAINLVIDLAAKRNDEKAVTKLVEKMKADGIAINKRTVLVLRSYAAKLIPNEKANIEKEEAKEFGELEALLKA